VNEIKIFRESFYKRKNSLDEEITDIKEKEMENSLYPGIKSDKEKEEKLEKIQIMSDYEDSDKEISEILRTSKKERAELNSLMK
jgi:hypothetical protein